MARIKYCQVVLATVVGLAMVCMLAAAEESCPVPEADHHPADADGDGKVTTEEFIAYAEGQEAAKEESKGMDADGDGKVSAEEFVAFAEGQAKEENGPVTFGADNFDTMTDGYNAAFVQFSAPWCTYCKQMQPAWQELAETVHTKHSGVRVGTVNCQDESEFCEMFQIQGFPTLLLMKDPEAFEDATPVLYQKERGFAEMLEFLKSEAVLGGRD